MQNSGWDEKGKKANPVLKIGGVGGYGGYVYAIINHHFLYTGAGGRKEGREIERGVRRGKCGLKSKILGKMGFSEQTTYLPYLHT